VTLLVNYQKLYLYVHDNKHQASKPVYLNSNLGKKDTDPKETVVRQGAKPYASFVDQILLCLLMDQKMSLAIHIGSSSMDH
jgi:hypothetical protein